MRIVIDLDGVICKSKKPSENYSEVGVNHGAVEKLKSLKRAGHEIVIHTARHMRTCGGDAAMAKKKIGALSRDWLKRNSVPFDELIFGKPYGQIYIDDLAHKFKTWADLNESDFNESSINIVYETPWTKKNMTSAPELPIPYQPGKIIFLGGQKNASQASAKQRKYGNKKVMRLSGAISNLPDYLGLKVAINNHNRLIIIGHSGTPSEMMWDIIERCDPDAVLSETKDGPQYFRRGADFVSHFENIVAGDKHSRGKILQPFQLWLNELIRSGKRVEVV